MIRKATGKSLLFVAVLSMVAGTLANRCVSLALHTPGNAAVKINAATGVLQDFLSRPLYIDLTKSALLAGFAAAALVWLFYLYHLTNAKNYMPGAEHGTARWSA